MLGCNNHCHWSGNRTVQRAPGVRSTLKLPPSHCASPLTNPRPDKRLLGSTKSKPNPSSCTIDGAHSDCLNRIGVLCRKSVLQIDVEEAKLLHPHGTAGQRQLYVVGAAFYRTAQQCRHHANRREVAGHEIRQIENGREFWLPWFALLRCETRGDLAVLVEAGARNAASLAQPLEWLADGLRSAAS
jgi:hypothetical protein